MIVLVYGGRDFGVPPTTSAAMANKSLILERQQEREALMETLSLVHEEEFITKIVSGLARGADSIGVDWANDVGVEVAGYPAQWDTYGNSAGPRRNQQMLDEEEIELAVEARGGKGTADMRRRLEKAGIRILCVDNAVVDG